MENFGTWCCEDIWQMVFCRVIPRKPIADVRIDETSDAKPPLKVVVTSRLEGHRG